MTQFPLRHSLLLEGETHLVSQAATRIANEWRESLQLITCLAENLDDLEGKLPSLARIQSLQKAILKEVDLLSQQIARFCDLAQNDTHPSLFRPHAEISKILQLLEGDLKAKGIVSCVQQGESLELFGLKHDFQKALFALSLLLLHQANGGESLIWELKPHSNLLQIQVKLHPSPSLGGESLPLRSSLLLLSRALLKHSGHQLSYYPKEFSFRILAPLSPF